MIVGDVNSHNYLGGGNKTDAKGMAMETFMTRSNICPGGGGGGTCVFRGRIRSLSKFKNRH